MTEFLLKNPSILGVLIGAIIAGGSSLLVVVVNNIFEVYKSRASEKKIKLANFSRDLVDAYYFAGSYKTDTIEFREGINKIYKAIMNTYPYISEGLITESEKLYDTFIEMLPKTAITDLTPALLHPKIKRNKPKDQFKIILSEIKKEL